eukprot:Clim_evm90s128 gene=Clim_evmTU90s128
MADPAPALFDPSMKKKKKKKKTNLDDLDAELENETQDVQQTQVEEPQEVPQKPVTQELFGKKKKKKTQPLTEEELEAEGRVPEVTLEDKDFQFPKRKKKQKKRVQAEEDDFYFEDDEEEGSSGKKKKKTADDSVGNEMDTTWAGTDRDYTYDELLQRVFQIMKSKNPDFVAGEKKKLVFRPPQVVRVGAKKTAFANFPEICKALHRQPDHLLAFLLTELGTTGNLDGANSLVIKGRFQQKQIENVLRKYILEYVTCHTCKSPETILTKENRLYYLHCETCGASCTVAPIKSGFSALTGKRSAMRAQ